MVKHPFSEVPSALTCHTVHFSESLAEPAQCRAGLQLLRGALFSERLPPLHLLGRSLCAWGCCKGKGWVEDHSCTTF